LNDFYVVVKVSRDLHARSTNIVGIREDIAGYLEQYGDIADVQIHEIMPKQLTFRDIAAVKKAESPPASAAQSPAEQPQAATPAQPPPAEKPKRERLAPIVPTWEQVLNYCRERRDKGKGMTDDAAEAWFDNCCTTGWRYGRNMTPVRDWQAHFRTGERHVAKWEQERADRDAKAVAQQGYAPSFDLPAFEQSTLVVPVFEKRGNRSG